MIPSFIADDDEVIDAVLDSVIMAGGASIDIFKDVRRWEDGARKEEAVAAIVRQMVRTRCQ